MPSISDGKAMWYEPVQDIWATRFGSSKSTSAARRLGHINRVIERIAG